MDEELRAALRLQVKEMADGVMDALAIFATIILATTKVDRKAFKETLTVAADALKKEGKGYAAQVIRGTVERL